MNGELLTKLDELFKKLEGEMEKLKNEYIGLTDLTHKQTVKDKLRINAIKKEAMDLRDEMLDLKSDIDEAKKINEEINKLEVIVFKSRDVAAKYIVGKELDELKKNASSYNEYLEDKYENLLEEKEEDNEKTEEMTKEETEEKVEVKKNKPSNKKKNVISAVAILLALGLTLGILKGCESRKASSSVDNDVIVSDTLDEEEAQNEIVGTFTDINDAEELAKRASEVVDFLDTNNPGHDYTVEEIENIIKWINGGVVESVGQDEALFTISRVETLMNRENQGEVKEVFDASDLFLDGSQGQKLASKIYDSRVKLQETKGTDDYQKNAEDFATLLVNSWVLNGTNNEVSAYMLETSGMKALVDKYFLNTFAMIDAENIKVTVSGATFTLDEVAEIINRADCPTEVTADNGETFTTYMNKFSSDMIGMVTEATLNKNENASLTLTK